MIEIKCAEVEREELLNCMNANCPFMEDESTCKKYDCCDSCLDEEIDWNISDTEDTELRRYSVLVKEVLSRIIKVTANTEREAISKVKHMYDHEQIVLNADDFSGVNFKNI